jgi:hypothetical protein
MGGKKKDGKERVIDHILNQSQSCGESETK